MSTRKRKREVEVKEALPRKRIVTKRLEQLMKKYEALIEDLSEEYMRSFGERQKMKQQYEKRLKDMEEKYLTAEMKIKTQKELGEKEKEDALNELRRAQESKIHELRSEHERNLEVHRAEAEKKRLEMEELNARAKAFQSTLTGLRIELETKDKRVGALEEKLSEQDIHIGQLGEEHKESLDTQKKDILTQVREAFNEELIIDKTLFTDNIEEAFITYYPLKYAYLLLDALDKKNDRFKSFFILFTEIQTNLDIIKNNHTLLIQSAYPWNVPFVDYPLLQSLFRQWEKMLAFWIDEEIKRGTFTLTEEKWGKPDRKTGFVSNTWIHPIYDIVQKILRSRFSGPNIQLENYERSILWIWIMRIRLYYYDTYAKIIQNNVYYLRELKGKTAMALEPFLLEKITLLKDKLEDIVFVYLMSYEQKERVPDVNLVIENINRKIGKFTADVKTLEAESKSEEIESTIFSLKKQIEQQNTKKKFLENRTFAEIVSETYTEYTTSLTELHDYITGITGEFKVGDVPTQVQKFIYALHDLIYRNPNDFEERKHAYLETDCKEEKTGDARTICELTQKHIYRLSPGEERPERVSMEEKE